MKGLVLAGGKGTRLRPITHTSAKQLIPIANKPILAYGLEALAQAGIRQVGMIVGDTAADIRAAVGDGSAFGLEVTYLPQEAPLGLAHAVWTAKAYLGGEPFLMFLGDNLIKDPLGPLVAQFERDRPGALLLLAPVPNPSAFGVVELAGDRIVRLIEKPKYPPSNLALVGVYLFSAAIFEAIPKLKPSGRGELEITEAIQVLLESGQKVVYRKIEQWWKDTGKKEDLLEANRFVLKEMSDDDIRGSTDQCEIRGPVRIGAGTRLVRCRVTGPCVVGENCFLEDATLGPFTSISSNARIIRSEIHHSILMEDVELFNLPRPLTDSLLGRGVRIVRDGSREGSYRLMLGDQGEIQL
ncbi:MAG: glucose-1-phosphate thymidylyltransferase [Candidatus Lindowbacteria bacterium RIFCSPLOWO2_12_FULL_62_27]|nr:MAG: glucose-1-phosphate thymidylyltransferase [Candidatus Lindowbacteria bacterium RIFCSPLOWO2_12_FULL_62_27]